MALNISFFRKNDRISPTKRTTPEISLLTDIDRNSSAQIMGFAPSLSADRKAHLQAYGIIPGNTLWVQQKEPVTIVQVEHTEIALEAELAEAIYVERN
ncbi:MAG: ferrous iron transport protein A [Anaerolineae bacterium]|nr:ferrous iron transport protein A [Anaerolineae bacterium]MBT4311673.1 ferrous iron transport protein A [Anaerolineae bacterium]MBT4843706.1 ferrous iron transport protein A [Anaerolineae bacterium]MBT6813897.1 ferrous iron transport protein A [Anaerolineae bacterium]MBT7017392.1 ferrous iron transport protein A [Anaerolineae bacterium]